MDMPVALGIILLVVLLLAVGAVLLLRQRGRSQQLRERFGPEYERTLEDRGDRRAAEQELASRQRHREQLDIRPLDPVRREEYLSEWRSVQARFVDEPVEATRAAHTLIKSVMRDRGYPVDDFEQRAADISVDHPEIVEDYRVAYRISSDSADGRATTEDLREAVVRYRSLFSRLLEAQDAPTTTNRST